MYIVDNAVIMAAGMSSRFAPLSYEVPKALIEVKGEVLIERQIRQLQSIGIKDIYVVVGYKAEQFSYLCEKLNVNIIVNNDYELRNNHSSIYAARSVIRNTYICSADNYFLQNPFERMVEESYYSAVYVEGETREWCIQTDIEGYINSVTVGGNNSWIMLGHAFWSEDFSRRYLGYLEEEYELPQTKDCFWENIFVKHTDELKMKIRKYSNNYIFEFDTIEELRQFDKTYIYDTRSLVLKDLANQLGGTEAEIEKIQVIKNSDVKSEGFQFSFRSRQYSYMYGDCVLRRT